MITSPDFLSSFEISDLTLDTNLQNAPFVETKASSPITASITSGQKLVTASADIFDENMAGRTIAFVNPIDGNATGLTGKIETYIDERNVSIVTAAATSVENKIFWIYGVKFSVTALAVAGDNMIVRRVRVINFGTRTPPKIDGLGALTSSTYEGFPMKFSGRLANDPSFNAVMEDCIFEQPYPGPARELTAAVATSGVSGATNKLHLQPLGSVLRNCYFNFEFVNPRAGNPVPISGVSFSGSGSTVSAIIRTQFPHDLAVDDFVEIYGSDVSAFNGRFPVTQISSAGPNGLVLEFRFVIGTQPTMPTTKMLAFKSPAQTMPVSSVTRADSTVTVTTLVSHNRLTNDFIVLTGAEQPEYNGTWKITFVSNTQFTFSLPSGTPATPATGDIWLDRRPTGYVRILSLTEAALESSNYYSTLTTGGPHYRRPGDWIMIGGVLAGSGTQVYQNPYNNYVEVTDATRTTIKVRLNGNSPNPEVPIAGQDCGFGTDFQAISNNGGLGGGYHSNVIANCKRGGSYHDFWWEVQHIARRNYYYNVGIGPLMVFALTYTGGDPGVSPAFRDGTITSIDSAGLITMELDQEDMDPAYAIGLAIRLWQRDNSKFVDAEILTAGFNASDKYEMTFRQTTPVFVISAPLVRADLWFQQSLMLFEDNIIELALEPDGGISAPPVGIGFGGPFFFPIPPAPPDPVIPPYITNPVRGFNDGGKFPWLLQSGILRDNHIRKVGGVLDPGADLSSALTMNSCRALIAEGNIFPRMNAGGESMEKAIIFRYSDTLHVKSFNNQRPNGSLWQFFNNPNWKNNTDYWLEEIQTQAEDMVWVWKKTPWHF